MTPGGWPGDPAGPDTPVARTATEVAELAEGAGTMDELVARQSVCRACPRLVAWREQVAITRRRAFRDETYWARPVPGWGADRPRLLIVGLAPAAHGGNRTGRVFTGDRSGDFLFASLYRCGWAAKPTSVAIGDGQRLLDARMAAVVRCAPPANKPEPAERDTCAPWLAAELRLAAADLRVIVCLGGWAWQALWPVLRTRGFTLPRPRPAFGHGAEVRLASPELPHEVLLLGCYHPSQQNTFTGRVTPDMLDAVFARARACAGLLRSRHSRSGRGTGDPSIRRRYSASAWGTGTREWRENMHAMTVRLLILVQEATFANVLAIRLEAEPDIEIVAELHTSAPSPHPFTGSRADVALIDGDFPGDAAFSLCEELSRRGNAPFIVILSHSSDPGRILRALEAGVVGWVRKDESLDRLLTVIYGVARGETWLPVRDTGQVLRLLLRRPDPGQYGSSHLAVLTQREREVLVCLAEGTGRRDMANHLHMSPNTVRTHLQNLMAKLDVHSALEAVALTRSQLGS